MVSYDVGNQVRWDEEHYLVMCDGPCGDDVDVLLTMDRGNADLYVGPGNFEKQGPADMLCTSYKSGSQPEECNGLDIDTYFFHAYVYGQDYYYGANLQVTASNVKKIYHLSRVP